MNGYLNAVYRSQRILCSIPFGSPDSEDDNDFFPSSTVTIDELIAAQSPAFVHVPLDSFVAAACDISENKAFEPMRSWRYIYDFGDSWIVNLSTERIETDLEKNTFVCLTGERSAPPDDFGGIHIFNAYVSGSLHPDEAAPIEAATTICADHAVLRLSAAQAQRVEHQWHALMERMQHCDLA